MYTEGMSAFLQVPGSALTTRLDLSQPPCRRAETSRARPCPGCMAGGCVCVCTVFVHFFQSNHSGCLRGPSGASLALDPELSVPVFIYLFSGLEKGVFITPLPWSPPNATQGELVSRMEKLLSRTIHADGAQSEGASF